VLTVAGNNEELVILGQVVNHNVGECGHDLLFRRELGALLELEISNGSRESEISVDAAKVDKTTGSRNARLLA